MSIENNARTQVKEIIDSLDSTEVNRLYRRATRDTNGYTDSSLYIRMGKLFEYLTAASRGIALEYRDCDPPQSIEEDEEILQSNGKGDQQWLGWILIHLFKALKILENSEDDLRKVILLNRSYSSPSLDGPNQKYTEHHIMLNQSGNFDFSELPDSLFEKLKTALAIDKKNISKDPPSEDPPSLNP